MNDDLKIKLYSLMVDCKQPKELAEFYTALLGWSIVYAGEEYVAIAPPGTNQGGYPIISFQQNDGYEPPVWPEQPGAQQQMVHLDFAVNDLEKAVEHALGCGARVATEQFPGHYTVLLDPAGHPFCLCGMKPIMESEHFALL